MVSNDPKFPKRFLRISIQVQSLIFCSPTPYISITKPYGQKIVKTLALWSPVYPDFRIQKVESLIPHVSAKIAKRWTEKKAAHYNLRVVLGRDMGIGRFQGVVRIDTNLKKFPTYDLRVTGVVEGPVKVLPRRGSIFSDPAIADGMAVAGFSLYGKGLKISKVVSGAKGLKNHLITVEAGRKYYLVAIWPGGPVPVNPYSILVKVYTNNPVQPMVQIPVNIYSRRVLRNLKQPMGKPPSTTSLPVIKGGHAKQKM